MAESKKIPSSGNTTPEYTAVRKSYKDINAAIIPQDFISRARSCGLLPSRNPSNFPLDAVLDEISRDPVNCYTLQHVLSTLNVGSRFDKGIKNMEKTFQRKGNTTVSVNILLVKSGLTIKGSLVPRPLPCFQCYTQKRGRVRVYVGTW